jgi:hypothetical protein
MICYICQNEVYLPVELVCFPCYDRQKIHCLTYVRICVSCAIPYLQLDKSVEQRESVKCLFCSKSCDTKKLTLDKAFVFDFLLIRGDGHSNNGHYCPFCFRIISTSITEHIRTECPQYYEQCICGRSTTREWSCLHKRYCCQHHQCSICKEYIPKKKFELHCFEMHDLLLCEKCGQYISVQSFSNHVHHSCPNRIVQCSFCTESVPFAKYESHLMEHEKDVKNVIESVRELSLRLFQKYASIQKKRTELFQNFYLES